MTHGGKICPLAQAARVWYPPHPALGHGQRAGRLKQKNAAEAVLLKGNKIIFLKTGTIFIVPVLLFWLIHRNIAYQVVLKFLALYTSSDIRPPVFECR